MINLEILVKEMKNKLNYLIYIMADNTPVECYLETFDSKNDRIIECFAKHCKLSGDLDISNNESIKFIPYGK